MVLIYNQKYYVFGHLYDSFTLVEFDTYKVGDIKQIISKNIYLSLLIK